MKAKVIIRTAGKAQEIQRFLDPHQEMQVGRSPLCQIHVDDRKLSRIHCSFSFSQGSYFIKDNISTNGTYVNQKKISAAEPLKDNDVIRIGDSQLLFNLVQEAEEPTPRQSNLIATKIDLYDIIKYLGGGGNGEVYLAKQSSSETLFALKILKPEAATDPFMVKRFIKEARACASLNHPVLIKLYDVGMFEDRPYLVLEYAHGRTLSNVVAEKKRLDPILALKITEPLTSALEYSHGLGIIHRDIKPGNVLVTDDYNEVKLIDMGMVKILNESGLTLAGQILGTPRYMPPEQIEDASTTTALADIYGLGATLYSMLAGLPPYHELRTNHLREMLQYIVSWPPMPLENLAPDVPSSVLSIVQKAMARDPKNRFKSAGDMGKEVAKVLQKLASEKTVGKERGQLDQAE